MSDFDKNQEKENINKNTEIEVTPLPAAKPDFKSWLNAELTPPSPRSRFNFSNNRIAPLPAAPVATPAPAPRKHTSTPRPTKLKGKDLLEQERSPLVFNVAQLLRETDGSTRSYDVEAPELTLSKDDNQFARNIKGHVRFTKIPHEILVQGPFQADVNMVCVRCLEDFTNLIEIEVEDEYKPSIDIATGLPHRDDEEFDEDDDKLLIDPNHMLNLGEALRQQFLVSLPMHPLHSEDCPGLYTYLEQANADVPEAETEAEAIEIASPELEATPVVDKRWAALAQLLDKVDEE
jgi:uncharacterized protein